MEGKYTSIVLQLVEEGTLSVEDLTSMKETEDRLVATGKTPTTDERWASTCEALTILQPQS